MGCDIHHYIEVRRNGVWELHDWEAKYRTDKEFPEEDGTPGISYGDGYFEDPHEIGRSYDLFAILANVRNGVGFAGVKTGAGFVPICEPKGLPNDVSPEVQAKSDEWDGDGHSHSWHTLATLQSYDWDQGTEHQGWVDAENFTLWATKGKPEEWCGGISGQTIQHLSNDGMRMAIKNGKQKDCYTLVRWTEKYRDSVPWFLDKTLPALAALGNPEDVRLVFWFDN